MTKKGVQITCSGCGCTTFVEDPVNPKILKFKKDDTHVVSYNENQSESWVKTHQILDLCPRCQKIHEKMLCEFYEKCGEARDDE